MLTGDAPAFAGTIVTLLATGEGQTDPAGVDGLVAFAETLPVPARPVTVRIGGVEAEVISSGGARDRPAGYFEVRFRVPEGAAGALPVTVVVGGASSQRGVTIFVAPSQ